MTDPDLMALVRRVQEQAKLEATRADGSVDALAEAVAFRRLIVEAASEDQD